MKYLILITATLSLSITNTAFAQQADPVEPSQANAEQEHSKPHKKQGKHRAKRAEQMFSRLDVNADGEVDLSEFLAHSEQRFQRMDLNGNGYVTLEEAKEAHRAMRKQFRDEWKKRKAKAEETEAE